MRSNLDKGRFSCDNDWERSQAAEQRLFGQIQGEVNNARPSDGFEESYVWGAIFEMRNFRVHSVDEEPREREPSGFLLIPSGITGFARFGCPLAVSGSTAAEGKTSPCSCEWLGADGRSRDRPREKALVDISEMMKEDTRARSPLVRRGDETSMDEPGGG